MYNEIVAKCDQVILESKLNNIVLQSDLNTIRTSLNLMKVLDVVDNECDK